jgi:hypothetical protein
MAQASGMNGALIFPPQEKVIFGQGAVRQLSAEIEKDPVLFRSFPGQGY